jgi:3-dehydroquinate synthetase
VYCLQALEAVALEAGLADLARQALSADPEAAAQLKRYEAAVVRLEKAKAAEKELEAIMKVCIDIRTNLVACTSFS